MFTINYWRIFFISEICKIVDHKRIAIHVIILSILYSTVSVQQMDLLPENASQNDAIFARSIYCRYGTTSQCLGSYGCAITMVYVYMY